MFPFTEERVPMNAANLCPSPVQVAETVSSLTRSIDVDCSFQNRERFSEDLERARSAVANQIGVEADEVALVRNTSEANNVINNGLDLGAGDEVVLWDQNHPTNNVAWAVRARRRGFALKHVTVPPTPSDTEELIEPFRQAITPNTRVLALTHASNVSGIQLPVRELCEIARRAGIHVHVDGAQTWGALQLDPARTRLRLVRGQRPQVVLRAEGGWTAVCPSGADCRDLAQHRSSRLGRDGRDRVGGSAEVRVDGPARRCCAERGHSCGRVPCKYRNGGG